MPCIIYIQYLLEYFICINGGERKTRITHAWNNDIFINDTLFNAHQLAQLAIACHAITVLYYFRHKNSLRVSYSHVHDETVNIQVTLCVSVLCLLVVVT